jgi:RND family efflux transporter MFP subunit
MLGLIVPGCRQAATEVNAVRGVRAVKVGDLKAIEARQFPGRARARSETDLSFRVAGSLVAIAVDIGSKVNKGDVIAELDARDYQAALDGAQGNLARAQANLFAMQRGARPEEIEQLKAAVKEAEAGYKQALAEHTRNDSLLKKGAVSRSEFDLSLARHDRTAAQLKRAQEDLNIGEKGARPEDLDAKRAEIKALEAAATSAQNQLEDCVLRAPFDGNVAARYVDNFQTVQPRQPVIRLLDDAKIEVTVQVPENLITFAPRIKQAVCRFDALAGREFVGQVTKVGSEASQATRTYPVTVEIDQPDDARILPGMAATVSAKPDGTDTAEKRELIVPAGALFGADSGSQTFVWVVSEENKQVVRRAVRTGNLTSAGVVVAEGLQAGEWVVTSGVRSLQEKQVVRILQDAGP